MTTLTVHAYDWAYEDDDDLEHLVIRAWCLDRDSKPYLLRINDFPAFGRLELPHNIEWTQERFQILLNWLEEKVKGKVQGRLEGGKKIYYYQGDRYHWMPTLTFKTIRALYLAERILSKGCKIRGLGFIKANIWETRISPVRKLLTLRGLRYAHWFQVPGQLVPEEGRISTLEREYYVEWGQLTSVSPEESKSWMTYPRILAFDIESYSDNHKAMPDRHYARHDAYMISCIYQRLGQPETRERYLILLGDCDEIDGLGSTKVKIIRVKTQRNLCYAFAQLVTRLDPEILTGYNIFGFDYPYLDARLEINHLGDDEAYWPPMGRLIGRRTKLYSSDWSSSAYKNQSINYLTMEGRISVDMLPVIRRDFKLHKYDLDTVGQKFLGRGKHDVSAPEMFEIYENLMQAQAEYHHDPNADNYRELAQAKADMTRVSKYCLEDSELVIDLMVKLRVWIGLVEMSSIAGVTIMETYTRGQQIRCLSLVYNLASLRGFVLNQRNVERENFVGGFVFEPIPGVYDHVECVDFSSLYPSIMMAYNIDFTTLVPPESKISDELCNVIEWDDETPHPEDNKKSIKKHHRFRYIKAQHHHGILPQLVRQLVEERKQVRRQIKDETDPVIRYMLDKRQLALKVTANSMYGFLNAREGGRLPLQEGAMSITAMGRQLIQTCNEYIQSKYNGKIVYGDSVTGDTPLLIRRDGAVTGTATQEPPSHTVAWTTIEELFHSICVQGPSSQIDSESSDKSRLRPDGRIEVWSDQGWTEIRRVIRHRTTKRLYRVATHTGIVDVTEDHSLLHPDGTELRPSDIQVGTMLCHRDLPDFPSSERSFNEVAGESKLEAARKFHLAASLGYHPKIDPDSYAIRLDRSPSSDRVKKLLDLGSCSDYVYDLETQNHHFAAGIGRMIVHNTDSTMFQLPGISDGKEAVEWGFRLEKELSDLFPDPLRLEFEKIGRILCIKKKKYAYWQMQMDRTKPDYGQLIDLNNPSALLTKGIILARRDNCLWQRRVYHQVLLKVLQQRPIEEVFDLIVEEVIKLAQHQVPWSDLVIIKELGNHYKQDNYHMKVFSEQLKQIGKPASPGDRLEYLIVDTGDPNANTGVKMRLPETYLERLEGDQPEYIDKKYYLEHVLMNCVEQLFQVGYRDELKERMRQARDRDITRLVEVLKKQDLRGRRPVLNEALDRYGHDPEALYQYLLVSPLKNRTTKLRPRYVTHYRKALLRITDHPIKMMTRYLEQRKELNAAIQRLGPSDATIRPSQVQMIKRMNTKSKIVRQSHLDSTGRWTRI